MSSTTLRYFFSGDSIAEIQNHDYTPAILPPHACDLPMEIATSTLLITDVGSLISRARGLFAGVNLATTPQHTLIIHDGVSEAGAPLSYSLLQSNI